MRDSGEFDFRKIAAIGAAIALFFGVGFTACGTYTTVAANEIVVKQNVFDGKLQFWTQPGLQNKFFGKTTTYEKSSQYSFSACADQGTAVDQSIKVRFNDGGHGNISGTLRWELPLDEEHLASLHTKFGSQEAIEQQLIRPVVERAVYMSGPLMSSKESSAERRSDLIQYIEDQVLHGVYQTATEEAKVIDPLSNQERTVTRVKLVKGSAPGTFARQEASPLADFGIKTYSFNINGIAYDQAVEGQINDQQKLAMEVQTSIAHSKRAEQDAITAAKQGEADAAKAKWAQEVLKTTAVTAAEQAVDVQKLAVQKAGLYKEEQTLIGEGEAARRAKAQAADGQLDKRLAAYVEVQKSYAEAMGKQSWVPQYQFGGSSGQNSGAFSAQEMMGLLTLTAARDLNVDPTPSGSPKK